MHVATHTRGLPLDQGIIAVPSGRCFSLDLDQLVGSSLEGIFHCKEDIIDDAVSGPSSFTPQELCLICVARWFGMHKVKLEENGNCTSQRRQKAEQEFCFKSYCLHYLESFLQVSHFPLSFTGTFIKRCVILKYCSEKY